MRSLAVPATLTFALTILTACGGSSSKPTAKPSPSASPSAAPVAKQRDRRAECLEIFEHTAKLSGTDYKPSLSDRDKCLAEDLTRAEVQCFRDATDLDQVSGCMPQRKKQADDFGDMDDTRDREARTLLNRLAMAARLYQVDHGAFAKGDTGVTPGPPLCEDDHSKRRQPDPADFAGPIWTALEFTITDPYVFSYRYVSDGKSFTATAQGDNDCNDRFATYTVKGSVSSGGEYQRSEIEVADKDE